MKFRSKVRSLLRRQVNAVLKVFGVRLVNSQWGPNGHYQALSALVNRGFTPDLIIDVGAAQGKWTGEFLGLFPAAEFLLVEPLPENKMILEALSSAHPRVRNWPGVAGASWGETRLVSSGDQSSLFAGSEFDGAIVTVPVARLDDLVTRVAFKGDFLLKIDVQGSEMMVLEGALGILPRCKAILVELTVAPVYPGAPLAGEVISWLNSQGFELQDICSYVQRPKDGLLSQFDALFVRKGSELTATLGWR
jgi:FkbM family methyltransferase